ncbi:hypothetical protein ACWD00_33165 [Streptomyces viridiviolaceus]
MTNGPLAAGLPPLPVFWPLPPSPPSLGQLQDETREALTAGTVPMPSVALHCQQRVFARVREQLWQAQAEDGARLYVLEFAGPAPRVKIGRARSTDHLIRRIQGHLREKNKHGYGLIDACVTPPCADAERAEKQALQWMSYAYQLVPRTHEEFLDAHFVIAEACADMGVFRYNPHEDDD